MNKTGLSRLIDNIFNTFSKIGHTHTISQISNFPKIPSKTSDLVNDSGFSTTSYIDEKLENIPTDTATTDEILNFIGGDISNVMIDYEIATVSEVQSYINT